MRTGNQIWPRRVWCFGLEFLINRFVNVQFTNENRLAVTTTVRILHFVKTTAKKVCS